MILWSCHIPLWSSEIHCRPGWSVRKTDGAHNHKLAQIFHVWLLPRKPSPVPSSRLEPLGSLFTTYPWMAVYFQFKPLLRQCSPHTPSWLVHYVKLEFCSANHSACTFLIGCIVWVSGSCSHRCWHVAALLLAFPRQRAWLSSWRRWHVDNPTD